MTDEIPTTYDPVGESFTNTHRYAAVVIEETVEETKRATLYPPEYFDQIDGL